MASASQGNFPTTHLRRHTHTTTMGPPVKKKNAVRLLFHTGFCCKRCIEMLSALRACESWSIANPGRDKKTVFFSRRNNIETVMVSVTLDVLKQYFGIFFKNGPVANAQFLNTGTAFVLLLERFRSSWLLDLHDP